MEFADNIVQFERVSLCYSGGADVLRDVSFALAPGTLNFVTGPSGAGKSSLLRLCGAQELPSRGEVRLFGSNVRSIKRELQTLRRRIGVAPEGCRLMGHLSAFDNVALPLRLAGYRRPAYEKDVRELVTWVGLGGKMDERASVLSTGERQRIVIARAVVGKPDLLLADDPTAALDDDSAEHVMRLLLNIHRFGTTVIIATANRKLAANADASELRLSEGRIAETAGIAA